MIEEIVSIEICDCFLVAKNKSGRAVVANVLNCDPIQASSNSRRDITITFGLIPLGKVFHFKSCIDVAQGRMNGTLSK